MVTNGVDYWRGLYDLFWCRACGDRVVRGHVGLCNRGGDLGPRWYIPAVVDAAIQGKHGAASLVEGGPSGGVADSLGEAKAAFRAAWEQQRPQSEGRRAL